MDEQIQTGVQTQNTQPQVTETPTMEPTKHSSHRALIVGIVIVMLLVCISIVSGLVISRNLVRTKNAPNQTPTPTQVTSANQLGTNPIATTSAFMQMEQSVASLSSTIASNTPVDQTVAPPVLDLPLGFSK